MEQQTASSCCCVPENLASISWYNAAHNEDHHRVRPRKCLPEEDWEALVEALARHLTARAEMALRRVEAVRRPMLEQSALRAP